MPKSLLIGGKTYVYDDNNKLVQSVEGDQTKNPAAFASPIGGILPHSYTESPGAMAAQSNLSGDLTTDVASQLPLMLIPGGTAARTVIKGAASFASGLGIDQLVNKLQGRDKSVGDSVSDAAWNTATGMTINRLANNLPNPASFEKAKGWGARGVIGGILKVLQGEPTIDPVSPTGPVVRGPGGQWMSNAAKFKDYQAYLSKQKVLNIISNVLGFGLNAGIDVNTDKNP